MFPDVDLPDSELTMAVMQFGQFIDHDFGLVPFFLLGKYRSYGSLSHFLLMAITDEM